MDPSAPSTTDPFTRLIEAARTLYPDFDLLESEGALTLRRDPEPLTRIRLEVVGAEFGLQSIEVETADGLSPAELAARTTLDGPAEEVADLTALFQPGTDSPGSATTAPVEVHNGKPAWLELTFSEPVQVSQLTLRNVAAPDCRRLVGLEVTGTTAEGETVTLYEAAARKRQLRRLVRQLAAHSPEALDKDTVSLLLILAETIAGHYAGPRQTYKKLKPDPAIGAIFRKVVSKELLKPRELEWTAHGAQRSFRFWPHDEKVRYIEYASEVARDLSDLTENVCFGFGAALATVRDGDLIPHDDDLDLIIGFEPDQAATLPEAHALVAEHLEAKGYTVTGDFLGHRHVAKPGVKKLDVFSGLFEGDRIAWYPGKRGALRRENMFPTTTGTMLGVPCPLPHDPLIYLETIYGEGWRIPDPVFKHTWVPKTFADQRGPEQPAPATEQADAQAQPDEPAPRTDSAADTADPGPAEGPDSDDAGSGWMQRLRRKRR